jgi:hypothetical protein
VLPSEKHDSDFCVVGNSMEEFCTELAAKCSTLLAEKLTLVLYLDWL